MIKKIFDNNDFIVVSKPEGIGFHNEAGDEGFFNIVRNNLGYEIYPVHRLDKMTSGLIIFAKTKDSANKLSVLFREREVEKYYIALSDKKPSKKMGKVVGGIEKARDGKWKLTRERFNMSVTVFTSLRLTSGKYFFIVKPLTGRTHQIRVVLKSLGSPIMGDYLYADASSKYDRGYLHSWAVRFSYKGRKYEFFQLPESGEFFQDEEISKVLNEDARFEYLKKLNGAS